YAVAGRGVRWVKKRFSTFYWFQLVASYGLFPFHFSYFQIQTFLSPPRRRFLVLSLIRKRSQAKHQSTVPIGQIRKRVKSVHPHHGKQNLARPFIIVQVTPSANAFHRSMDAIKQESATATSACA